MNEAQRLTRLVTKRDELRREADQKEGALKQCLMRLQGDHGCISLDDAKKLLTKLKKESDKLGKELEAKLEQMEAEYGELIRE